MPKRHGDSTIFNPAEGVVNLLGGTRWHASKSALAEDAPGPATPVPNPDRVFRFDNMLPGLEKFDPDPDGLVDLGFLMEDNPGEMSREGGAHVSIPAGFTYLGQFIAHEVTFDKSQGIPEDQLTEGDIVNGRTPSLDLDSLYGLGPESELGKLMYQEDGVRLRLGRTIPTVEGNATEAFQNDLPRDTDNRLPRAEGEPINPRTAIIGNSRNDDTLALAQTHVAFLKFHNAVVSVLERDGLSGKALLNEARKTVIQHFQQIVLYDFLPRIVQRNEWQVAIDDSSNLSIVNRKGELFMPVEFSAAAFRLGHSMVRQSYEWNRIFQSPEQEFTGPAKLHHLFAMTGLNGNMRGTSNVLPSSWVIDWTRFYDIPGFKDVTNGDHFNRARRIDILLSPALKKLPSPNRGTPPREGSLAARNLLTGRLRKLPCGQDVARRLNKDVLEASAFAEGPHAAVLKQHKFDERTPLWYYILKEAEVVGGGERLGPVGSCIVAETLVRLIRSSEISILKEDGWKSNLFETTDNYFSMAELLAFISQHNTQYNELNPLDN